MNRSATAVPDHSVYPARRPAHAAPVTWELDDDLEPVPGDEWVGGHAAAHRIGTADHHRASEEVELDLAGDVVDLTRVPRRALTSGGLRRPAPTLSADTSSPAPSSDAGDAGRDDHDRVGDHARRNDHDRDQGGAPIAPTAIAPTAVLRSRTSSDTATVSVTPTSTAPDAAIGSARTSTPTGRVDRRGSGRVRGAFVAIRCWLRSHATWQVAAPCLAGVITGAAALAFTDGTAQRFGQVVITAALVTIGFAWTQSVQDQRRRQQDLRFRLASGNLERADLSGTVLDGFTLWGQNLRGARLAGASADHVLLSGADLRDASMPGVSMRAASLCGADLSGARAYRADFSAADLTGAIVNGVGLEQAVLRGARLEGADLSDADLSGADLRGATHDTATVWDRAIVSAGTDLPEDLDLSIAGLIRTI